MNYLSFILVIALFGLGCAHSRIPKFQDEFSFSQSEITKPSLIPFETQGTYQILLPARLYNQELGESIDTEIPINMVFFPDGMFCYNIQKMNGETNVSRLFEEMEKDTSLLNLYYNSGYWGLFSITDQKLEAKYIQRPGKWKPNRKWKAFSLKMDILNDTTLKITDYKPLHEIEEWNYDKLIEGLNRRIDLEANYTPCKYLPKPMPYLRSKNWFIN
tara:strand:+ start:584 stop:1231 length:648 start_codon:yes stop_codon:yes gene_type:complete